MRGSERFLARAVIKTLNVVADVRDASERAKLETEGTPRRLLHGQMREPAGLNQSSGPGMDPRGRFEKPNNKFHLKADNRLIATGESC